jgi:hypothetical protein
MKPISSHIRVRCPRCARSWALKGFIRNRPHHRHFGAGCGGRNTRWASALVGYGATGDGLRVRRQPLCSYLVLAGVSGATIRPMLFDPPREELSDEEVAAVLRQSIAAAGRLSRQADLFLAGVCAEHLVEGLRAAGLLVIRPVRRQLHR